MSEVLLRRCRLADLGEISDICCRTGFGGEGIDEAGVFRDRRLFALLFCEYYVRHERENCFVACATSGRRRVVGYILGCPDTRRFVRRFALHSLPRIALRALLITSWRYPRTLRELLRWARGNPWNTPNPAGDDYPAHLHIDILPEFQRRGIGGRLLERLESALQAQGVEGIHLETSNLHRKALPFYAKHGYRLLIEKRHEMWSGVEDYRSLVYVKRLVGPAARSAV